MNVLDLYLRSLPSNQNAVDIFKGTWASVVPGLETGYANLFRDNRVDWAIEKLGPVAEKVILELGPLEAGHSYMLEKQYNASVLAIEANTHAYLKCLIVKELFSLQKCRFLLGDFIEYLRQIQTRFYLIFASGVLYHMADPVELLHLISLRTDRVFLWTHYYDRAIMERPELSHKFVEEVPSEYNGFRYTKYKQVYEKALEWQGFCGGHETFSYWLPKADILRALVHFGLKNIVTGHDHQDHQNGPAFCIAAQR